MKVYIRNRNRDYGNPNYMFPYQAALWFKPEGRETRMDAVHEAAKFHHRLTKTLKWSQGALGRVVPQLVDVENKDTVGILFNNRQFADDAIRIYRERKTLQNT